MASAAGVVSERPEQPPEVAQRQLVAEPEEEPDEAARAAVVALVVVVAADADPRTRINQIQIRGGRFLRACRRSVSGHASIPCERGGNIALRCLCR